MDDANGRKALGQRAEELIPPSFRVHTAFRPVPPFLCFIGLLSTLYLSCPRFAPFHFFPVFYSPPFPLFSSYVSSPFYSAVGDMGDSTVDVDAARMNSLSGIGAGRPPSANPNPSPAIGTYTRETGDQRSESGWCDAYPEGLPMQGFAPGCLDGW
jgi:hypothetical protein